VTDWEDREVLRGETRVAAEAVAETTQAIGVGGYGVLHVHFTVAGPRGQLSEARTNCGLLPPPGRMRGQDPGSLFGLCFTNLHLAAWTGVRWERRDMVWAAVEPEKGRFNWSEWHRVVEDCAKAGIEVMPILDYCAPWASPLGEEADRRREYSCPRLEEWRGYVTAVVARYRGRVKAWEVWSEPGLLFGCGSPQEYLGLLKTAYEAAKRADPSCTMVGPGGGPLPLLEEVLKTGAWEYMDAVPVHPYAWYDTLESAQFLGVIAAADDLMVRHGGRKPIWLTEFGWSASDLEPESAARDEVLSERLQAAYVVRSYVIAASHPALKKAFWFLHRHPSRSLAESVDSGEGLFHPDGTLKPSALAYRTMVDMLDGAQYVKGDEHDGLWVRTFSASPRGPKGGRRLVSVLWSATGERLLVCRGRRTVIRARDLMGNPCEAPLSKDRRLIALTEVPIYLEGPPPVIGDSVFSVSEEDVFVSPGHPGRLVVRVRAPLNGPVRGRLAAEPLPGLTADPGEASISLTTDGVLSTADPRARLAPWGAGALRLTLRAGRGFASRP